VVEDVNPPVPTARDPAGVVAQRRGRIESKVGKAFRRALKAGFIGEELIADPLQSDDDAFFERRVVPFRDAVAMAVDDRITESVSKVAPLAAGLRPGVRLQPARARWALEP
jgi:hypothetical protein